MGILKFCNATTSSASLETTIANYDNNVALDANITALESAVTTATAALNSASTTDLTAAQAAVTNAVNHATVPGLNTDIDAALDANTNDYVDASGLAGAQTVDTTGGMDVIDCGTTHTFTVVADDETVATDAVGDSSELEVLLQQQLDANGDANGVSVWIETAAADGSFSASGAANFTLNNAAGDLALADLEFTSEEGWTITGDYATGL